MKNLILMCSIFKHKKSDANIFDLGDRGRNQSGVHVNSKCFKVDVVNSLPLVTQEINENDHIYIYIYIYIYQFVSFYSYVLNSTNSLLVLSLQQYIFIDVRQRRDTAAPRFGSGNA